MMAFLVITFVLASIVISGCCISLLVERGETYPMAWKIPLIAIAVLVLTSVPHLIEVLDVRITILRLVLAAYLFEQAFYSRKVRG